MVGQVTGSAYTCYVSKGLTINSLDTAFVNSSTGSHQSSHTNDNVNYFFTGSVTISYFPRGLDAIFKNLKAIYFYIVGLKEIHQSDLKPFPKLIEFGINTNQIEVLEEGLFDYNPNLEYISLAHNNITHIDSKLFDSLTKLRHLYLQTNKCINKYAQDRTTVVNLIKDVKVKCENLDYISIDQKLKFLESESKFISLNDFKLELENLESKINALKVVNFYHNKLQNLKNILDEKSFEGKNCSALNVKFLNFITNLKNLTSQASNEIENVNQDSSNETVSYSCMSFNTCCVNNNENIDKIVNLSETVLNVSQDLNRTIAEIRDEISNLKESFGGCSNNLVLNSQAYISQS